MTNPRETRTNAADSAPGVDDGPAGVRAPPVNSKPAGRPAVWIGVIVVCLIVLAAFFVHPLGRGPGGRTASDAPVPAAQPAAPDVGGQPTASR
jgi:hypothetical protein